MVEVFEFSFETLPSVVKTVKPAIVMADGSLLIQVNLLCLLPMERLAAYWKWKSLPDQLLLYNIFTTRY